MINVFLGDRKTRSSAWKQIRQQIQDQPNPEIKLDLALLFWKQASFEKPTIDWDNCESWPSAWDLINNNCYCTNAHSLGVAHTLLLADPMFDNLQLRLIQDRQHHVQKIVVSWHNWYLNHGYLDKIHKDSLASISIQNAWAWNTKKWSQIDQNKW
jgi:hypothetical protein